MILIVFVIFVNCERTVLFSMKRDLESPFTNLYKGRSVLSRAWGSTIKIKMYRYSPVNSSSRGLCTKKDKIQNGSLGLLCYQPPPLSTTDNIASTTTTLLVTITNPKLIRMGSKKLTLSTCGKFDRGKFF